MKDIHGKPFAKDRYAVCVNDVDNGRLVKIDSFAGKLIIPASDEGECGIPLEDFADENGVVNDYVIVRDPHKKIGYVEAARIWRNAELQNAGRFPIIPYDEVTLEQAAILKGCCGYYNAFGTESETWDADDSYGEPVDILSMIDAGIDAEPMWDEDEDDEEGEYILRRFIREAGHYLVFARGCRWNGASGYKIVDHLMDTVRRNYDVTITPRYGTPSGKTLVCREASHDVPTGNTTVIIALTNDEYERLKDTFFEDVEAFAEAKQAEASKYDKD